MKTFLLMHGNTCIALFNTAGDEIRGVVVTDGPDDKRRLPLCAKNSGELKTWIKARSIPVTRQGIGGQLNRLGVSSVFQLMLAHHGLSLTDHYWMKEYEDELDWEHVNLYTNDFQVLYTLDLSDDKKEIDGRSNFLPNASTQGDLVKKWIIANDGTRMLVKGNASASCRQSICEVFASQIHRQQNAFPYVDYKLTDIPHNGKKVKGCTCANFTDNEIEFVPAIEIVNARAKANDVSWYEFYISLCHEHGIEVRNFLEYQILTDFVITNTDRHFQNFGILRRCDTLQWTGTAPVFDSGNALFYDQPYVPSERSLLDIRVTSFLSREADLLRYVKNRGIIKAELLPDGNDLYRLLGEDEMTAGETNEKIVKAYEGKIKLLTDFQNGADIWSYKYQKGFR